MARQVFKDKQGEIKLSVHDLLNLNQSIVCNVGEAYLEDVQSLVLRRYLLLSFTYHLRKFGGRSNMPDARPGRLPFMRPED